jgi:FkbH-like protein
MKLIDALKLSHEGANRDAEPYALFLACGFSTLHFETFLAAHLAEVLPKRRIVLSRGTFGDLVGNLELAADQSAENLLVAFEWSDFDPRLSIRSLGGWSDANGIVENAEQAAHRLKRALSSLAMPTVVSFPGLPLLPVFQTKSCVLGAAEGRLRNLVAEMASWSASQPHMRVINPDQIAELSPPTHRWDVRNDVSTGFPYSVGHADALSALCVRALLPVPRRKGIITDLDDTLWRGIVGEVGTENVTWSLEHGSQMHGLYQRTLEALAETGILVAVASKNDQAVVAQALQRPDLVLAPEVLFPVEVHWHPKSESVARILHAWKIGAAEVVFIDDNPLEIAEVQSVFPELEGRLFPKDDPAASVELLRWLCDEFARESVSTEDKLRRKSLERDSIFDSESRRTDTEAFLQSLEAKTTIRAASRATPRAFELVNKTNQFSINGSRYTEDRWRACAKRIDDFVITVAYQDRFGPLGTIAIMAGHVSGPTVHLEDWVISCRAFSRRVEYRCLASLFDRFNKDAVSIAFRPTERNGPARNLLGCFFKSLPANGDATLELTRGGFETNCPKLYDHVHDAG